MVALEKYCFKGNGGDLEGRGALWGPGSEGKVTNEKWKEGITR